jgi:eukaryotic-like serine/threonine-protein kinase
MNNDQDLRERSSYCYRFGTAEFDEAKFELRVAGLPVEVERRALEVLAYLLRHAGEVVTKEELLSKVWAGRITVDKVLPNAINKLRRALGETNAEHLLTQARVGYRLDGPVERIAVGRQFASSLALAAGQPVPERGNFLLRRALGSHGGSEVWLAEHAKTREQRVYKFAVDGERLRALKREATLSRVLQESLEDHSHFVDIIDWNFEKSPYFLECQYGGQSLLEWAEDGLAATSQAQRLALFLQIADAVAAAHSVGVLHKDLKPANVLIAPQGQGWLVRLTDFGSGRLLDPERLERLGITRLGLTLTQNIGADSSGTPLYIAPEVFEGHAPTAQSDVFALGILLYQLLAGHAGKPLASGWEQDVADALLREDIRLATDGNPARRLASAADLAARLRDLDARRLQRTQAEQAAAAARRAGEALARSRARRPYLIALVAASLAGLAVMLGLYQTALRARNDARQELERATAINRFLNEDLIGASNPLVMARGQGASLKDVLLAARERVAGRFAAQPLTEASIHTSLATLLNTLDLMADALAESQRAVQLYEQAGAAGRPEALRARAQLARLLTRNAKFDEALAQISTLEQETPVAAGPELAWLAPAARGIYHMNRAEYPQGLQQLRRAIPLLREGEPENIAQLDALRQDEINALTQTAALAEARAAAQRLIDESAARPGDNGLVGAFARTAMARAWRQENAFDKAEALLLQASPVIARQLGEEHTRHLMALSELFDIAIRRGEWDKAQDYARRVHEGFKAKLGEDHNFANVTLVNWGQALYESGAVAEAQPRLRDAYTRLVAKLGAQSAQAQVAGYCLAATDLELGALDEAAQIIAGLDEQTLESAGADGNWRFRLDALRGLLLHRRGDRRAAEPLLRSAVDGMAGGATPESGRIYVTAKKALEQK